MDAHTPFRVIIVGGGATGLVLAHCFSKADIDFVLLEKGVIAPPYGNSITMFPNGIRILHQIGAFDAVKAISGEMGHYVSRDSRGKVFMRERTFELLREYTGYSSRTINRQGFLNALYITLPDKSRILEGACVEEINETSSGVGVVLTDGKEFHGDILIGADGIHSKVREIMWEKIEKESPGTISREEKETFNTTYCAIVGLSEPIPGFPIRDGIETTSFGGVSFLWTHMKDQITYTMFIKLPKEQQGHSPKRIKFTPKDLDETAARLADFPLNENVRFKQLWDKRIRAHMVPLEEGVLSEWFFGRTVLAGDAIHKVTPNTGMGGNMALEDAVSLANCLYEVVNAHPDRKPLDSEIARALKTYRDSRIDRVRKITVSGGAVTRLQAYDGWKMYFMFRWLAPLFGLKARARMIAHACLKAPKLSYVPFDEQKGSMALESAESTKQPPHKSAATLVGIVRQNLSRNIIITATIVSVVLAWIMKIR